MRDIPILFKGDMVKAIQDNRKSQTRRLRGLGKINENLGSWEYGGRNKFNQHIFYPESDIIETQTLKSPYGDRGDRLWVRETWCVGNCFDNWKPRDLAKENDDNSMLSVSYKADGDPARQCYGGKAIDMTWAYAGKWRPSIFMPQWVSRIILNVTRSRLEKLQDISEEDAEAEGCNKKWYNDNAGTEDLWPCPACSGWQVHGALGPNLGMTEVDCMECDTSKKMFKHLWNFINDRVKPAKHNPYTGEKEECYVSYPWEDIREKREMNGKTWYVIGNPMLWVTEFKKAEEK